MNEIEAKQVVCDAGRRLLKEGLVARTWGNISARVDGNTFVITPSGRTYEELTTDDIVTVTIEDLAYDSHIKPSSEKGLH
ncbi:MAG TPA: class II aldolase/adducin family protein, partial [Spirochaetota bacterium]|nr:class II aldolase/adducin family protein [Spirochaetota bacterium]